MLVIAFLFCFWCTFEGKNLETECFDLDLQQYCSNIDKETNLQTIINDIKLFENSYQFKPDGIAYNISIFHANDDENTISSIIMLGTVHSVTSLQIQWDVTNWFTDLILNTSQFYGNKNVFFEAQHDLQFGLKMCDYLFENNAAKYRQYWDFIIENKTAAKKDIDALVEQMNSGLKGKLLVANIFMELLQNSFDSDLQMALLKYMTLFKYNRLKHNISIYALDTIDGYLDRQMQMEKINQMKRTNGPFRLIFKPYFDLLDGLLLYAYWYQDSLLMNAVIRWKQASYYTFQRKLFDEWCVAIERDNYWTDKLVNSIMNDCLIEKECSNVIVVGAGHTQRIIDRLSKRIKDDHNDNNMILSVSPIKIPWVVTFNETNSKDFIQTTIKNALKKFIDDLVLFQTIQL